MLSDEYTRCGVYRDDWKRLVKRLKAIGGISVEVTRRKLWLGIQDSVTGWFEKKFVDSTIEGIMIPRSSSHLAVAAGTYARTDYLFLTADVFEAGDEILDENGNYYEVKAIRKQRKGDSFSHREIDLTELTLHEFKV